MFRYKIKRYIPEILIFSAIFAVLMIDLNPDFTFMNKAADSMGYIYSAKYLYPSYHMSAPFYLLVGHLFLYLPFGTEAFRMGLIGVLSTMGACVFIYLIIRQLTQNRWYGLFGVVMYGLSALVLSQSIIVNTYPFTTMFAVGAYYFAINKRWKLAAVMLGCSLAVHLLGFIVTALFLIFKEYRKNWKALLITASFVLFYLYVPLTNREPYMWLPDPSKTGMFNFVGDTFSVIAMLVGAISVYDLPKKILDTIGVVGISIGVMTIVPIWYYFKQLGKKMWWSPILWLIIVPIVLFVGELDMNTFDYMTVAMPFLVIVAGVGLSMLAEKYKSKGKVIVYTCAVFVIGIGAFNVNYFDIGRTLDPNMSAAKLYRVEFNKMDDGDIFMPNGGWNWESIYLYNRENDKDIYPICIDILPSQTYRDKLKSDGINLIDDYSQDNLSLFASQVAKSIVELNDNVYITVYTDVKTFGADVVNANHNTDLIITVDESMLEKNATNPDIHWKPDNPYKIMDTSLFISDWGYVLMSQYNFRLLLAMFLVFYALMTFIPKCIRKKKVQKDEIFSVPQEKENSDK